MKALFARTSKPDGSFGGSGIGNQLAECRDFSVQSGVDTSGRTAVSFMILLHKQL
jgi:hypothetical protein